MPAFDVNTTQECARFSSPQTGTNVDSRRGMLNSRHRDLVTWQRADDLFVRLHKLSIQSFPAYERFELSSQLRRAAYSVPANIVEGMARRYRRARLHFLNIAEGSLAETGYCIHVAWRLGYIDDAMLTSIEADLNRVGAPLAGLIRATRKLPSIIPIVALAAGFVIDYFWRQTARIGPTRCARP